MLSHKIVVRYADGRIAKGRTTNFNPDAPSFHLIPADGQAADGPLLVEVEKLKAIFFVRDFAGNPKREDRRDFLAGQPQLGRKVEVEFQDGEVIRGFTPDYKHGMRGFFLFPADTESNTQKVFAVSRAVKSVRLL